MIDVAINYADFLLCHSRESGNLRFAGTVPTTYRPDFIDFRFRGNDNGPARMIR